MKNENLVLGLSQLGKYIKDFLLKRDVSSSENYNEFEEILRKSEIENPWFTQENQKLNLQNWSGSLTEDKIKKWLNLYEFSNQEKKIGLILAGNIPMVGFHDIISVLLSGNIPLIKLSSKDRLLIPFLLKKWNGFSGGDLKYEFVEKLENFDAVIATGSNNTARYLDYYFKDYPNIIRKNRTSIAVIKGDETNEELQLLAEDIFTYFGLGCRNVTRIFIPKEFELNRLFENFIKYQNIINHNKYANNYDYNKAVYLLNQELFWDNNFVMLKEDDKLFSPLSVLHFSRYESIDDVKKFINVNEKEIQCIVAKPELELNSIYFGVAQNPSLETYADNIDTMMFLSVV